MADIGIPFYRSKNWWKLVVAVLVPVLNQWFGIGISETILATIVISLVGWFIGGTWLETKQAELKARAEQTKALRFLVQELDK